MHLLSTVCSNVQLTIWSLIVQFDAQILSKLALPKLTLLAPFIELADLASGWVTHGMIDLKNENLVILWNFLWKNRKWNINYENIYCIKKRENQDMTKIKFKIRWKSCDLLHQSWILI